MSLIKLKIVPSPGQIQAVWVDLHPYSLLIHQGYKDLEKSTFPGKVQKWDLNQHPSYLFTARLKTRVGSPHI
jgi:hypothetical protein